MRFNYFILLPLFFVSCQFISLHKERNEAKNLDQVYHKCNLPTASLLACGCKEGTFIKPVFTTIFYPIDKVEDYHMYITDSLVSDKNDLSQYHEVSSLIDSLYQGKLLRIDHIPPSNSCYVKIVGRSNDSLHISDAIKVSSPMLNSEKASKKIKIKTTPNHTSFTWNTLPDKAYLALISNRNKEVRSCMYTQKNYFNINSVLND